MITAILLSFLSLLITFLTGNLTSGVVLVPLYLIVAKVSNDELKAIVGEGSSELLSTGFLLPLLVTTNQPVIISISVFLFVMLWILTLKFFVPHWIPAKQRLFIIGVLSGVLVLLHLFLFITILPMLAVALYKSRNNIKLMASLITGFIWILLGFFLISPVIPVSIPIGFKAGLNMVEISDMSLRYFLYAVSFLTLLWSLNIYRVRHRWRPESRYLIFNMVVFSFLGIAISKFTLLAIIVISLPVLHIAWNMQIKKSNFSLAVVLTIVILGWLNQQYVLNFLNLQH
ncbi:MAG: hypothetical protein GXO48_02145 [Chlorobi bacterium]|nr:hypothetical protein [Chlorobiota bacterium]